MADSTNIVRAMRERQFTIRRQLDARNISLKALSLDSGIGYSTLLSYFPNPEGTAEPALMPVSALYALCGHVPDDLLSLLLPDGRAIVVIPEGTDYDEYERHCRTFLSVKGEAHRPDSPAGREISDSEAGLLGKAAVPLRAAG